MSKTTASHDESRPAKLERLELAAFDQVAAYAHRGRIDRAWLGAAVTDAILSAGGCPEEVGPFATAFETRAAYAASRDRFEALVARVSHEAAERFIAALAQCRRRGDRGARDQVADAFAALRARGVWAVVWPGSPVAGSDSPRLDDLPARMSAEDRARAGVRPGDRGYAYCDPMSVECGVDGRRTVRIRFGAVSLGAEGAVAVGRTIAIALEAYDVETWWDGTTAPIELRWVRWFPNVVDPRLGVRPVATLNLGEAVTTEITSAGIATIGELCARSPLELLEATCLGFSGVQAIERALDSRRLRLRSAR